MLNWRELFTVIIFRNFIKLLRWERKMKLWENCNANENMTTNKCVLYWTRDISSWSLEEKLHWYNMTHSVNSSLSIQFWERVTCPALRRKGILRIASVLHLKRKSWIEITEFINRHGETCKQGIIIIKRIKNKQTNKQKYKHNNFLIEEQQF